jgi:hypothetical protein
VRLLAKHPRNKQICICGHNINSHEYSPTLGYSCRSGNIWCECAAPLAVYSASDARLFKRSTHGFGKKHALGLGIASLLERNGHGEWLIVPKCEVGGCLNTELTIACLDRNNQVVEKAPLIHFCSATNTRTNLVRGNCLSSSKSFEAFKVSIFSNELD